MIYRILSVLLFVSSLQAIEYDQSENIVVDSQNKLMWQDNNEVTQHLETFVSAKVYCEHIILNGYIDWRAPTIDEVVKIIDVTNKTPVAKEFQYIQKKIYTTNSIFVENSEMIWGVDFDIGKIVPVSKSDKNYIRCVRDI
ncbi:MAG: DUF1566 domain-containing protein [Arcobacteraceae bacterium]